MKKLAVYSMSFILAFESGIYAQTITQAAGKGNVAVGGIATGVGGTTVNSFQGGVNDINQTNLDYTKVLTTLVANNNIKASEDREYLQAIGKRISDSLRELIALKQKFRTLSDVSNSSDKATLNGFLGIKNEIVTVIESIRIEIEQSSIISRDTLPSSTMAVGNQTVTTGAGSTINMTNALSGFTKLLDKHETEMNGYKFVTLMHNGVPVNGGIQANALNPDLKGVQILSQEEIKKYMLDIESLSVVDKTTRDKQQFLADGVVNQIKTHIEEAGTGEFLRIRNENDKTFFVESYKKLHDMFLIRSYMRKKYGIQLGAIQPMEYPRVIGNLERLTKKELALPIKTALNSIRYQTAMTDSDLVVALNNARQFVEVYDRALTPILSKQAVEKRAAIEQKASADLAKVESSSWKSFKAAKIKASAAINKALATFAGDKEIQDSKPVILDQAGKDVAYNAQDTGIMARASSFFTTITGQTSTVEALLPVMRLVLADIREEVMLSQGDWGALKTYHQQRYMDSQEEIVKTFTSICNYDNNLSAEARAKAESVTDGKVKCGAAQKATGLLGGMRTGGGNFKTNVVALMDHYEKYEMARAQKARALKSLLDTALAANAQDGDRGDNSSAFDVDELPVKGKKP